MKGTSREAALFIMVILFASLAIFVTTEPVLKIDLAIEDAVFNTRSTIGVFICKALSFIGKWYVYAGVSCVLFLVPKTRFSVGLPVGFTLGIAMVMNKILKALLMIQRPDAFRLTKVTGYSFPSGHTMYGTAFISAMTYILFLKYENEKGRAALVFCATLFLLAVGFSRVYLGAHHPSDAVGGYLAGMVILITIMPFYKRFNKNAK